MFFRKLLLIFTKPFTWLLRLIRWFFHQLSLKVLGVVLLLITAAGISYIALTSIQIKPAAEKQSGLTTPQINGKPEMAPAIATLTLNKEFTFATYNNSGNKLGEFKYTIENAELRDEIIVRGQKATAIQGKTFLILNIKLTNDQDKNLNINSRDYVRLSSGNNEWLAPDVHNDPLEIQAISTKYSRLGFAVFDNQRNFKLKVGEIDKDKTDIEINFKPQD
jgi:hypothetical protein